MTREIIEDFRFIVIPYMVNRLEEINYEGQGGSDAKEFMRYFNEICDLAIKALAKEPTTKNDLGVDCISRAEAIKCLECELDITGKENMKTVVNYINSAHDKIVNLPSVIPQEPKTGHWINKQHLFGSCSAECSSCHKRSKGFVHDNGFSLECKYFNFCPNCGAKMVEAQGSDET